MREKIMTADEYIHEGYPKEMILNHLGIPRSSYYYDLKDNKLPVGRPVSTHTQKEDSTLVVNTQVLEHIKHILEEEFVDYGYLKTTHALRQYYGYIISPKKVYRLMSENHLLNKGHKSKINKRQWVQQLVPNPTEHFSYLEFDIKYMYIKGKKKSVLLLTVIDVYSRWVLGQYMGWQIKKGDVIKLFDRIFANYTMPKKLYIRNDNGAQMIAIDVQKYFKDKGVTQEFTKPATPEQNAHIESYHSILERVICQRYELEDINEARDIMKRFVIFYNTKRIHSGLNYNSPKKYLEQKGNKINIEESMFSADHKSINTAA